MKHRPTRNTGATRTGARRRIKLWLLAAAVAGSIGGPAATPAADQSKSTTTSTAAPAPKAHTAPAKKPSRYRAIGPPASARNYYAMTWGVDQLSVQLAQSGELVRFSYRVADAAKAKALNEKASSPYLMDEEVHAVLQVPTMEKVGPLRQSEPPVYGKSYWMVFSNKGNIVKAGHRVSVVIGQFRVDGLVVQ